MHKLMYVCAEILPGSVNTHNYLLRSNFRIPGHFWPLLCSSTDNNTDNNTHYNFHMQISGRVFWNLASTSIPMNNIV